VQSQHCQTQSLCRSLEQENRTYLSQVEQSHSELFLLKEENEALRSEMVRRERQDKQERETIWSSKDQEVSCQLKLKDQEVERIRVEAEGRVAQLQEDAAKEVARMVLS
jgi:hypothetical protein